MEWIPAIATNGPINPDIVAILVLCSGPFSMTSETIKAEPTRNRRGTIDAELKPFCNPGKEE